MKYFSLIVLLFCTLVFAQETAHLGYDIEIKLGTNTPPVLNNLSSLDYKISASLKLIEDIKIEVIATNGVVLNTKEAYKSVELLQPEIPFSNSISFRVNKSGQHKITIKVTGSVEGKRHTDRFDYFYFTTSENKNLNKIGWDTKMNEPLSVHYPTIKTEFKADENGFYHIAAADENLNMITKKLTQEQFDASTKGTIGTVTIQISYIMRNRQNDGAYAYKNSLMQLINGTTGAHLAWSYSDNQGKVIFPAIPHPGSDGVSIRVYSVRFIAGGLGYGVCNANVCVDNAASDPTMYSQFYTQTTSKINVLIGGNVNLGLASTPFSLTGSLRAMWIKHDMDDTQAYLEQNSTARGPFTAEWKSSSTIGNFYSLGGNIHFKADVADGTNHTVLHELGHNVMYNAGTFPTTPTDCPNPHYVQLISGTQCAWTEGWASAFANMVNDDPTRCFAPSTSNCISYEVDPSFDECFPDWDCGLDGHKVEGHVTGALWDLYDAQEDGLDINDYGSDEILSVTELSPYPAFLSWWSVWLAEGHPAQAANSLYQNAIKFTQSYDVEVFSITNTGNINPVVNEDFVLAVDVRNTGDVTSVTTPVALYRSLVPVFNGFEPVVLNHDYLQIEKNQMVTHDYILNENEVGTYYYRACYNDTFGLDENNVNDCSEVVSVTIAPLPEEMFIDGFE